MSYPDVFRASMNTAVRIVAGDKCSWIAGNKPGHDTKSKWQAMPDTASVEENRVDG